MLFFILIYQYCHLYVKITLQFLVQVKLCKLYKTVPIQCIPACIVLLTKSVPTSTNNFLHIMLLEKLFTSISIRNTVIRRFPI